MLFMKRREFGFEFLGKLHLAEQIAVRVMPHPNRIQLNLVLPVLYIVRGALSGSLSPVSELLGIGPECASDQIRKPQGNGDPFDDVRLIRQKLHQQDGNRYDGQKYRSNHTITLEVKAMASARRRILVAGDRSPAKFPNIGRQLRLTRAIRPHGFLGEQLRMHGGRDQVVDQGSQPPGRTVPDQARLHAA